MKEFWVGFLVGGASMISFLAIVFFILCSAKPEGYTPVKKRSYLSDQEDFD